MTEIVLPADQPVRAPADAGGSEGLRAELVRRHAPAVLAVCLAGTKRVHDAEDLMQETFVKAFGGLDGLRDRAKALPWLVQIARRLCIDHLRRRKPMSPMPVDLPVPADSRDPRIERLHAAIAELPESHRETLSLYYLDGRTCAGVAAALGIPQGTVRMRLFRARVMLYDLLARDDT